MPAMMQELQDKPDNKEIVVENCCKKLVSMLHE